MRTLQLLPCGLLILASLARLDAAAPGPVPADIAAWYAERVEVEVLAPAFDRIDVTAGVTGLQRPGWWAATVSRLQEDGPAARAGLQSGDRIVGIDGWRCHGMRELRLLWDIRQPGADRVTLQVRRDDELLSLEVVKLLPAGRLGAWLHFSPQDKWPLPDSVRHRQSGIGQVAALAGHEVDDQIDA